MLALQHDIAPVSTTSLCSAAHKNIDCCMKNIVLRSNIVVDRVAQGDRGFRTKHWAG